MSRVEVCDQAGKMTAVVVGSRQHRRVGMVVEVGATRVVRLQATHTTMAMGVTVPATRKCCGYRGWKSRYQLLLDRKFNKYGRTQTYERTRVEYVIF